MESLTVNWMFKLTFMGIVDTRKKRPEWRSGFFADEPTGCVTSKLKHTWLKSTQIKFLVGIVRVYFTKHILITQWIGYGMTVSSMDFQNWFNNLKMNETQSIWMKFQLKKSDNYLEI